MTTFRKNKTNNSTWPYNYGASDHDAATDWWRTDPAFESSNPLDTIPIHQPVKRDTTPSKYYLAYGMNTNFTEMANRCPNAENLGTVILHDYKLAFRTHCDVVQEDYATVECVLWHISEACEYQLDLLEGYPTYYDKSEVEVIHNGKPVKAMVYYMTNTEWSHGLALPSQHYLDCVCEGYLENGVPLNQVRQALYDVSKDLTDEATARLELLGYAARYNKNLKSANYSSKDRWRDKSRTNYPSY